MTRNKLSAAVDALVTETHDALQTVVDALNQGQRKKLLKDERVKVLLDRYGVETDA